MANLSLKVEDILYEDNHIIIVYKHPGQIVQGDKSGDRPLSEMVKEYLKNKYNKPGNVFCGVVHRIDRPTAGLVIFAKTSKALSRLNEMLRKGAIKKTYRAIVEGCPNPKSATLRDYLFVDGRLNKTFISDDKTEGVKKAILSYKVLSQGDRYSLIEVDLETGRKHQIRAQMSAHGNCVKGDLKYGAKRSNPDGCISLLAYHLEFEHPVSHKKISIFSNYPSSPLWETLAKENKV